MPITDDPELYIAIYQNSQDAIIILSQEGFLAANPAALKLFEVKTEAEFLKKNIKQLSPPKQANGKDSEAYSIELITEIMKEGSKLFDWIARTAKGRQFLATVLMTRLEMGDEMILQATVRDVTEEKEKIEEMENLNKLMIGRELKMVELKERLANAKKKK